MGLLVGLSRPAGAQGSPIQLQRLEAEIWPEYDRPETLVIYRAELAPTVALPAKVTFQLPGYLQSLHVVAIERDGVLVEVKPEGYELTPQGESLLLTLETPVPRVQFEYYDPQILTKQGQQRQFKFDFVAPYATTATTFRVQEPVESSDFALTPPATTTVTGGDGLTYHNIEAAGLAAAETFAVNASYSRASDTLSAENLGQNPTEHAADLTVVTTPPPADSSNFFAYVLMGLGAILLLAVGGYWLWSRQAKMSDAPAYVPPRRKSKSGDKPANQAVTAPPAGNFCYRCGAPLRDDANFCHICGAERRK